MASGCSITDCIRQFNPDIQPKAKQLECIQYIMEGRDVIANLPVGFGKSMIYQCLPLVFQNVVGKTKTIVLVISPLNIIQNEQTVVLQNRNISTCRLAFCDNDGTNELDKTVNIKDIAEGRFQVVFCHPEAILNTQGGRELLSNNRFIEKVAAVVVDECHVVESCKGSNRCEEFETGDDVIEQVSTKMDLLASYDDENTSENNASRSPSIVQDTGQGSMKSNMLENEWLSFEQMIAPGGVAGNTDPVKASDFLVDGIVAYPGMQKATDKTVGQSGITDTIQSSPSCSENEKDEGSTMETEPVGMCGLSTATADDDDAFFKLRKQVKERDRSSSSDRSSDSNSASDDDDDDDKGKGGDGSSRSPSPPNLSPVTSVKSHDNEPPPDITLDGDIKHTDSTELKPAGQEIASSSSAKDEERKKSRHRSGSNDRRRSKSRDRKRSHRSRHHGSSKSKRRRSKSRDRKRRSRDRHRRRERKSSRDETKTRDRKDSSKSDTKDSASKDHEHSSKSDSHRDKSENKSDRKRHRSRSHSRDRKDRKKDRKHSHRSRSRERKRSRSKDRKSRDERKSKSRERRRSKSKDRKRRHRSKSRDRQRSRSRERLRSRSPVMPRKLTFKEQMRQEFIQASKEMEKNKEKGEQAPLQLPLKRPGEPLKPADLLKGVKLGSGDTVTPQMALMQTMEAMHKKAQELTGVEVPKYYNPAAVNPLKYAEQVQKRKLLWSKKTEEKDKNEQIETQWKSAFATDNDKQTASKFLKLMGMKDEGAGNAARPEASEEFQKMTEEQQRKQTELFQRLDQEYAFARMTTHTQRGVGLGFATTVIDPNRPPTTTT